MPAEVLATTNTAPPTPPILNKTLRTAEISLDAERYSAPNEPEESAFLVRFGGADDVACARWEGRKRDAFGRPHERE
jgi:hypothetical protein